MIGFKINSRQKCIPWQDHNRTLAFLEHLLPMIEQDGFIEVDMPGRADHVEGAGGGRGDAVGAGSPHAPSPHLPPADTAL